MHVEALYAAAMPGVLFIGAAISYYGFTEHGGSGPVPVVLRGGNEDEPWGVPQPVRKHLLPGNGMVVIHRDQFLKDMTQEYDIIDEEE